MNSVWTDLEIFKTCFHSNVAVIDVTTDRPEKLSTEYFNVSEWEELQRAIEDGEDVEEESESEDEDGGVEIEEDQEVITKKDGKQGFHSKISSHFYFHFSFFPSFYFVSHSFPFGFPFISFSSFSSLSFLISLLVFLRGLFARYFYFVLFCKLLVCFSFLLFI